MKLGLMPVAFMFLVACGPSETDRTNMKEKMTLETQRAEIWTANVKSCARLASESAAFNKANHDKHEKLDEWWGGLGSGAKKKLIAENQAAWDGQMVAMVRTIPACPNEIKASMKGQ